MKKLLAIITVIATAFLFVNCHKEDFQTNEPTDEFVTTWQASEMELKSVDVSEISYIRWVNLIHRPQSELNLGLRNPYFFGKDVKNLNYLVMDIPDYLNKSDIAEIIYARAPYTGDDYFVDLSSVEWMEAEWNMKTIPFVDNSEGENKQIKVAVGTEANDWVVIRVKLNISVLANYQMPYWLKVPQNKIYEKQLLGIGLPKP